MQFFTGNEKMMNQSPEVAGMPKAANEPFSRDTSPVTVPASSFKKTIIVRDSLKYHNKALFGPAYGRPYNGPPRLILGSEIAVRWANKETPDITYTWYCGTVSNYDPTNNSYIVHYNDGDIRQYSNIKKKNFMILSDFNHDEYEQFTDSSVPMAIPLHQNRNDFESIQPPDQIESDDVVVQAAAVESKLPPAAPVLDAPVLTIQPSPSPSPSPVKSKPIWDIYNSQYARGNIATTLYALGKYIATKGIKLDESQWKTCKNYKKITGRGKSSAYILFARLN